AAPAAVDEVRKIHVRDAERGREPRRIVRVDRVGREAVDLPAIEARIRERFVEGFSDLIDLAPFEERTALAVRGGADADDRRAIAEAHAGTPTRRAVVPPAIARCSSSGTPRSCSATDARECGHVPSGCG